MFYRAGVAVVVALALANPAAWVARVNIDRAADHLVPLDASYLVSLGADAVPTLLERMNQLSQPDQCTLAHELLLRWRTNHQSPPDWRVWNRSEANAIDRVAERRKWLRALSEECGGGRYRHDSVY